MIRRPPRSTLSSSSAASDVYKRQDQYAWEVAATVRSVMSAMDFSNRYMLAWQSKVGFLPWLSPSTSDTIKGFGSQGHKYVLTVPIAFTSDHIETLFEIDIEYAEEAEEAGIEIFRRAPSLNGSELFQEALADIVHGHLKSNEVCTPQYRLNCQGCTNPTCRHIMNPIKTYQRHMDQAKGVQTACTVDALP
eukprot:TRINITY_DN22883_c0_g1_i5.p1 TRINITY_DN22883_c0_g1~~TRINITY_DN22883_c0_g1_i5.p1  ORF type:complete len:191 (-),score=40.44 TRINITY_DN22883_c0_g1_i5:412-984(-)